MKKLDFKSFIDRLKNLLSKAFLVCLPPRRVTERFWVFNIWVKIALIFIYVFLFFFYLYFYCNLNIFLLTVEDLYMLLKINGHFYFFLLFLSFFSSLPWTPSFKKVTFRSILKFLYVFFMYHTFFVLIFLVLPKFLF